MGCIIIRIRFAEIEFLKHFYESCFNTTGLFIVVKVFYSLLKYYLAADPVYVDCCGTTREFFINISVLIKTA